MFTQPAQRSLTPRPEPELEQFNEELSRAVWEVQRPTADEFLDQLRRLSE